MIKLRKRKGFTLTELAVVIAVIAVLIAVLVPTFYALINKANVSSDSQLTKTMNEAISIEEATSGIETPEDAINAALSAGYSVENLSAKSEDNIIVYDQESTRFVLISEDLKTPAYYDASTTKTDYTTATTWLFLETSDSVVTKMAENTYTINGTNSYILIGDEWTNAVITVQSASGIDTSQVSVASVTTTNTASSASVNPVATKTAVAADGQTQQTTKYPLIYNVKGSHLAYKGGNDDVKIYGSAYVTLSVSNNANSITISSTVGYVDVSGSTGTVKVDIQSGGDTQVIAQTSDNQASVSVTNNSGSSIEVTVVNNKYENVTPEEIVTNSSVYKLINTEIVTVDPTCTTSGYTQTVKTYKNSYTDTEVVETSISDTTVALGHTYELTTCEWAEGYGSATVTLTCTRDGCSDTVTLDEESITSEVTKEATCTADGEMTYTLTFTYNEVEYSGSTTSVIPATGHDYEAVVTEPTCTAQGYTTYTCSKCDHSYIGNYTEAKGHTEGEAVIENEVAATCTEAGSYDTVVYCTDCGALISKETTVVQATGHSYETVVTAPTCTEQGYTTYTCSACGDSYVSDYTDALGHSWDDGVVTTAATCTEDGVKTYTCTVCGETKTEAISATGHTPGEAERRNTVNETCTEDGQYESFVNCSVCDEELSSQIIVIPATGHSMSQEETVTLVADKITPIIEDNEIKIQCTYTHVTCCTKCDHTESTTETVIKSLSEIQSDSDKDTIINWLCYAGTEDEENEWIITNNGQWTIYFNTDCTEVTLTEYSGSAETLVVPTGITYIGTRAFNNQTTLLKVTVPDSVTAIGEGAFNGCSTLASISLPFIGASATACTEDYQTSTGYKVLFGYIFGTTSYTGGTATEQYYETNTSYATSKITYYIPTTLRSVILGDDATTINSYAFYKCAELVSITIGKNVTSIGASAFYGCTGLTQIYYNATEVDDFSKSNNVFYNAGSEGKGITVTIGANVEKIPAYIFNPANVATNCPNITSVVFANGSVCESIGDYAFWSAKALVSINLPSSLITIGKYAFYQCETLTSEITGLDNLTTIGMYAFEYCTSLSTVVIGKNVNCIGKYAFANCSALTSVKFEDTTGWYKASSESATSGTNLGVTTASINATRLSSNSTYNSKYWLKSTTT